MAHAAAAARGEELFVHLNRLWRPSRADRGGCEAIPVEPALPLPMVNMISGGLHAGGNLDIQDVLIIPVGASQLQRGPGDDRRALSRGRRASSSRRASSRPSSATRAATGRGSDDDEQAFDVVVDAIAACGFEPGRDVAIAVDVASSHFYRPGPRNLPAAMRPADRDLDSRRA